MRALVVVLGLAMFAAAAVACSDEKSETAPTETKHADVPGADLVRGLSGLPPKGEGAPATDDEKALSAVADDLVNEIEARHPGRLGTIDADLRSRDAERVQNAKVLLDQTIAEAAESSAMRDRVLQNSETKLTTSALQVLDLVGKDQQQQLVDAGQQLLCDKPKGADGKDVHLGAVNGVYGDGKTGALAAAGDTKDLVDTNDWNVMRTLKRVDSGELVPDPDSRLGAYAATKGYGSGTVGNAVHNAIGTIFVTFGNYGEERIGRVFNSPEAKALYDKPVSSCAGRQMAEHEYQYWQDVAAEDGWSPGGKMGSAFNPATRDLLQKKLFNLF
jgi:hypothetical protein